MPEKIYVPKSSAKEITFTDGGSLLRIGFHADSLIEFANKHKNAAGYVNLTVSRRRQPGERGDTHSVSLDDYVPKGGKKELPPPATAAARGEPPDSDSDVPFK